MTAAGAEQRAVQLSASLLQRLQLAQPPWEDGLRPSERPPVELFESFDSPFESFGRRGAGALPGRRPRDSLGQAAAPQAAEQPPPQRRRARGATPSAPARQQPRAPAQPSLGIPLIRQPLPSERRDADGGFGSPPPPAQQLASRRSRTSDVTPLSFEQWVTEEEVPETAAPGDGGWAELPATARGRGALRDDDFL